MAQLLPSPRTAASARPGALLHARAPARGPKSCVLAAQPLTPPTPGAAGSCALAGMSLDLRAKGRYYAPALLLSMSLLRATR